MYRWNDFKNKKTFKLALAYAIVGWGVIEVTSTISTPLNFPDWLLKFLIVLVVLGFPIFILFTLASDQTASVETGTQLSSLPIKEKINIPDKSIAVLPFLNMNKDAEHEYFADGITENILTQLASIENLKVISRTSIMRYKNSVKSVPEIAQELGVKYILEGSAQAQADKVRINVQLIEAHDDRHVWAKAFDEDLKDIFLIQNSVAREVVNQMKISIQPNESLGTNSISTKNVEAYDLYLKALHVYTTYTFIPDGWRKQTADILLQAIGKDPAFKEALSLLAEVYAKSITWIGDLHPAEGYQKSQTYLNESLKYGTSAKDYLVMSFLQITYHKNLKKGIELGMKALDLNPNDSDTIHCNSYWHAVAGNFDDAVRLGELAKKIEPASAATYNYIGVAFYLAGKYSESIEVFKESIKLHPLSLRQYDHLSKNYLVVKQYELALDVLNSGLAHSVIRAPSMVAYMAIAYHQLGEKEKSKKLIREIITRNENGEKGTAVFIVQYYAEIFDIENAMIWLEKSVELNDVELFWIKTEPLFNNIRDQRDFKKVLKKYKLDEQLN